MSREVIIKLGLDGHFATRRWEQPENVIRITKELGFGKTQIEEITLPALVCFQTGNEPPGFVPVRKMMMAQRKPIKTIAAKDMAAVNQIASVKILDISPPKESTLAEMIEGAPPEQAAVVMQKIREAV